MCRFFLSFRPLLLGTIFLVLSLTATDVFASCTLANPIGPPGGTKSCETNMQPCTVNGELKCISERDLCILEPIPGSGVDGACIPADNIADMGAFRQYVNSGVWQWAFGMGIAIAVLNGTIGGLEIVLSNGDSGKVEAGKSRFFWSAMGLVLLLLSGVILEFINPLGFMNI